MRTLQKPGAAISLAGYLAVEDTLSLWLATHSDGYILDVGCGDGKRANLLASMPLRLKRSVIAIDWSGEHRIDPKQRRKYASFEIAQKCRETPNVTVVDKDPTKIAFDAYQPVGFAVLDYAYSLDLLRRITESLYAAAVVFPTPNLIIAWMGYREDLVEEYPNEVFRYVHSIEGGDMYHFEGSTLAFKVFNATPELRSRLGELANS